MQNRRTGYLGKRNSGISLIGDLPWGSHFCHIHQTQEDLLEILVPYFQAGLEGNEFCLWVVEGPRQVEDVTAALSKALPRYDEYLRNRQTAVIAAGHSRTGDGEFGPTVLSNLDKALTAGFDGLRLACDFFSGDAERATIGRDQADAMCRYNVIAAFAYPRHRLDAVRLMEVMKRHHLALVKNAGKWEVIESSEARVARDTLTRGEEKLHSVFSNMLEGFAYHRIILDSRSRPCDYVFLEVNESFERLTGLKAEDILGKQATEALPGIDKDPTDWIGRYGKVALTGEPTRFESYSAQLDRWYSVSAFSPHKGFFAVTFSDITERVTAEQALRDANEQLQNQTEELQTQQEELQAQAEELQTQTEELNAQAEELRAANEELRNSEQDLREAHARAAWLARFPDENPSPVARVLVDGTVLYSNPAAARLPGWECEPRRPLPEPLLPLVAEAMATDQLIRKDVPLGDRFYSVAVAPVVVEGYANVYGRDVTERKQAESNQALSADVLRVLNESGDLQTLIGRVLRVIQKQTGFDAVGLRLREGVDYPYYQQSGFSEQFVREENSICARLEDGSIASDAEGRIMLECTCGAVLSGATDPNMACFTENGSFWTETSSELLELLPEDDPRTNPRNRCIHCGYQTVGLIPVRSGRQIMGLLQLNAYKQGRLTLESVRFFEHLADNIGLALRRKQVEEALRRSEQRLSRAQEIAHLGSWELDLVSGELTWSDEVYRIFGLRPQEFAATYEAFLEAVHPDDREAVDAAYTDSLKKRRLTYEIEHRIVRRETGEIRWVHERCRHVKNADGKIILSTGMVLDVTERRRAEEALRRSEERFRLLSETAGRLLSAENPQAIVDDLCSKIMEHLDCDVFFNYLVDGPECRLHLNACAGVPDEEVRKLEWLECGAAVCGCVARDGARIVAENIPANPDPRTDLVASYGIKAYACHPLLARSKVIGTLSFGTRTRTQFSDEDLSLMKTVADQVAVAMQRILDQRAIRDSEQRLHRLNDELEEEVQAQTEELKDNVQRLEEEIGRRVLAEGQLHRRSRLLEGFFGHTITPLAFMDRNFNFVRVNEAYAQADEKTCDYFVGKNHFALYPNQENEAIFRRVVETKRSHRAFAKPFSYPENPERGTSYWNWQLTPLLDERGEVESLVLNLENVTEQRAAAQELERRARQLQKLTLELSEAEDRERKRLAEILHDDLQQQLVATKYHLRILANRIKKDEEAGSMVTQIGEIIDDAVTKSRSLSHELSPAALHHDDLSEMFAWLANQVRAKHGLAVQVVANRIEVESDTLRAFMYKACQEMLFNVVKHARVNRARIRARRRGRHVCVAVSDCGRGFDPELLNDSAGFGLLGIRERVELLGGRMKIRSVKGAGSRFVITVPEQPPSPRPTRTGRPSREIRSGAKAPADSPHVSPKRIFRVVVADDHQIVRQGLATLLAEEPDMELIGEAANGREAVDLAHKLRPDVVIMDVSMPLMSGEEATRQIKAHVSGTRVIALSMSAEPETAKRMREAGAEAYLVKTDPSEALLAAIRGR